MGCFECYYLSFICFECYLESVIWKVVRCAIADNRDEADKPFKLGVASSFSVAVLVTGDSPYSDIKTSEIWDVLITKLKEGTHLNQPESCSDEW